MYSRSSIAIGKLSGMAQREEHDTGKRGAVRNKAGEPVDHSGPDLGVGPGTPATSGRIPEACPPILDVNREASDIAGVNTTQREALRLSQGKSGRARAQRCDAKR